MHIYTNQKAENMWRQGMKSGAGTMGLIVRHIQEQSELLSYLSEFSHSSIFKDIFKHVYAHVRTWNSESISAEDNQADLLFKLMLK